MEWKVGEYAIAKLARNKFEKIRIMKIRNFSSNKAGQPIKPKTFYYVCLCNKKKYMWLPKDRVVPKQPRPQRLPIRQRRTRRARQVIDNEEHLVPIDTQQASTSKPDLNAKFLQSHAAKVESGQDYINEYIQFAMRGKDIIFGDLFKQAENDIVRKSSNFNEIFKDEVSFEKKFEILMKPVVTKNEVTAYLNQSWRFNVVHNSEYMRNGRPINIDLIGPDSKKMSSAHITWCIVCGGVDDIQQCDTCPASYHPNCEGVWIFKMKSRDSKDGHSKNIKVPAIEDLVQSSTTCPSCIYGPAITYGDIVWNKNSTFPWWPAKILKPGTIPPCLLKKCNTLGQWPVKYYSNASRDPCCRPQGIQRSSKIPLLRSTSNDENKYSWVSASSICLFHPDHYYGSKNSCKNRDDAINEASHDFILTYLI